MLTQTEILIKTLHQMGNSFSSNEFSRQARVNGITDFQVASGLLGKFLHKYAYQGNSKRLWYKEKPNNVNVNEQVQFAINILKQNGYKILKPVSEYIEI